MFRPRSLVVALMHNRTPVLLVANADWDAWLCPTLIRVLLMVLRPADEDLLETFPLARDLLRSKERRPMLDGSPP